MFGGCRICTLVKLSFGDDGLMSTLPALFIWNRKDNRYYRDRNMILNLIEQNTDQVNYDWTLSVCLDIQYNYD